MHTALLDRTIDGLRAVRQHVSLSEKVRAQASGPFAECTSDGEKCPSIAELFKGAPDATNWRVIDHCSAITRTYALFEEFVFQVLREYIAFLSRSYKFSELGDEFAPKYTRGIGQILLDQDKSRYEKIDTAILLADANAALSNQQPYQIQPEAFLRTEQNLRMGELQRLFGHCGLSGIESWISKHSAIRSFFASESRLSETAESELKQIVEYRNEAAHGDVDQVLGTEVLIEVTEFFEVLLRSITDFVQYDTLRRAKEIGQAVVIGVISEQFHDDVVVAKIANSAIKVNDIMYIFGKGLTGIAQIKSIQLDDVDCETADITEEREVGLCLGTRAKVGCELVTLI